MEGTEPWRTCANVCKNPVAPPPWTLEPSPLEDDNDVGAVASRETIAEEILVRGPPPSPPFSSFSFARPGFPVKMETGE